MSTGQTHLSGNCMEVADLLGMVSSSSGLPVIDETGLTGKIIFDLRYRSTAPAAPGSTDASSLPPLALALEEQLGLKLESRRGPLDVLVIDSIQQPTEN